MGNILVIAPHPDDEVLGCGGTIAKYSARGHDVYLCIVTAAYEPLWSKEFIASRRLQIKAAGEILGIKKIFLLNFPTLKLNIFPQNVLNDAILKVINEIGDIEMLFIPHKGDLNKDHRLVFEAALVASRPIKNKIKKILSCEILSETEWGSQIEFFNPDVYVDISETFDRKIAAMKNYGNEIKNPPHPRSLEIMEILAKKRGSESGLKLAESFKLIREIYD